MNYADPKVLKFITRTESSYYKEAGEEVWKIKINGDFLTTNKGKSIWSKEHRARSAFLNLMKNSCILYNIHQNFREQKPDQNHWQNNPTPEEVKECIGQWEEVGYVEFVRIV